MSATAAFAAEVLEYRRMLSIAAPQVTLTVSAGNVTLASTDIYNPNVTISRSGSYVVFAGSGGTQITYGTSVATTQTVLIPSVNNITLNLGTGSDTFSIYGLSVSGNIAVNGQATGIANVSISAGTPNVTIGGSIEANFGGEQTTFGLFGSTNGGGTLTVNGSVNITEGGSGANQVNIYGPPSGSPFGGKLVINGSVNVLDSGSGRSGLRIDDGVTIAGDVSYDNSANTAAYSDVQIYSNTLTYGATSIAGSLSLALANDPFSGNNVLIQGFGSQLAVTGAATITSGTGADMIQLRNTWFKSTVSIITDNSPIFSFDQVHFDGSRFDGAVSVAMSGGLSRLYVGTDPTFSQTLFNSTFAAEMSGASASAYLSNPTSTIYQVFFNSTASFTGGTPSGILYIQGRYYIAPGRLLLTRFTIASPVVPPPVPGPGLANVSLTVSSNNVTLTSTDTNNPTVTVYRQGSFVVFSAVANTTKITYGSVVGTMLFVPIAAVNNLTVNLGTGSDSFVIYGLNVGGDITINGQPTGIANVAIYAGPPNVTIGGSIQANFGGEKTTFGLFGSFTGGGNLTVNGSVNITEGGAANKQINIYGPPFGNPTGGKLIINGNLKVVDTGSGLSGLRIDDGVTIGGNVSYDNAVNTATNDDVQIYSNSLAYGVTSIGGTLSLALANNPFRGNNMVIQGFGSQLPVTGAATIISGNGADMIRLLNTWFKSTVTVNSGNSPSFSFDQAHIEGDRIDAAASVTMSGARPQLYLGTESTYVPTVFNNTFAALMTGPSALAYLSNPTSIVNQVVFNSTASFTGGSPAGTLYIRGLYYIYPGKLIRTNFNLA